MSFAHTEEDIVETLHRAEPAFAKHAAEWPLL